MGPILAQLSFSERLVKKGFREHIHRVRYEVLNMYFIVFVINLLILHLL